MPSTVGDERINGPIKLRTIEWRAIILTMKRSPRTVRPAATSRPSTVRAEPAAAWLALDRQLCFALYATSLAMTKLYKPLLDPLGLTYPQYLVMLVLWEHQGPGPGVGEIGERLALDSGTLTPLLKRLEQAGLLLRLRDASDERRVRVALTAAGRALRARAASVPPAVAAASGCSLGELRELTAQLQGLRQKLAAHLDANPAIPKPSSTSA
jgi:MarR family transcriptional regulator, organic hydroperoxide resistance regulator